MRSLIVAYRPPATSVDTLFALFHLQPATRLEREILVTPSYHEFVRNSDVPPDAPYVSVKRDHSQLERIPSLLASPPLLHSVE